MLLWAGMSKTRKINTTVKTRYGTVAIILEQEPDMGGFMVISKVRPDVITWGKTQSHAKCMAIEAIECSIEGEVLIAAEKEGSIAIRKQRVAT